MSAYSEFEAWQRRIEEGISNAERLAADLATDIGELQQQIGLLRQPSFGPRCGTIRTTVRFMLDDSFAVGATVVVTDDSDAVVGTCTTGSSGRCSVTIQVAGHYTVTVTVEGCLEEVVEVDATCDINEVEAIIVCDTCDTFGGRTLFVGDANGLHAMTETIPGTMYTACYELEHPHTFTGENGGCAGPPYQDQTGNVAIGYELTCENSVLTLACLVVHTVCGNSKPGVFRYVSVGEFEASKCASNAYVDSLAGPVRYQDDDAAWTDTPFTATFDIPEYDLVFADTPNPVFGTATVSD